MNTETTLYNAMVDHLTDDDGIMDDTTYTDLYTDLSQKGVEFSDDDFAAAWERLCDD